jgi:hypothetical protein
VDMNVQVFQTLLKVINILIDPINGIINYMLRVGRIFLDSKNRFISDKLPVHIAACF